MGFIQKLTPFLFAIFGVSFLFYFGPSTSKKLNAALYTMALAVAVFAGYEVLWL